MHSRPIHLYSVQSIQSRHFNTFLQFLQSGNNYRWIEQCIEKKTTTKTAHSSLISQSKLKRAPPNLTAEKRKSRAHWLSITVDFNTSLPWIRSPAVPFPALHLQNHPSYRHSCALFFCLHSLTTIATIAKLRESRHYCTEHIEVLVAISNWIIF